MSKECKYNNLGGQSRRKFLSGLAATSLLPAVFERQMESRVIAISGLWDSSPVATQRRAHKVWSKVFVELFGEKDFPANRKMIVKADCNAPLCRPDSNVLGPFLEAFFRRGHLPWHTTLMDTDMTGLQSIKGLFSSPFGDVNVTALRDDASEENENIWRRRGERILRNNAFVYYGTAMRREDFGFSGTLLATAMDYMADLRIAASNQRHREKAVINCWREYINQAHLLSVLQMNNIILAGGPAGAAEWQVKGKTLLVGNDPVAVDTLGLEYLNKALATKRMPAIESELVLAAEEAGLGTSKPKVIQLFADRL